MIEGLDISHWQGKSINWQKMKDAGIKFIYLKCTEGTYYFDDCFEQNYANARKFGIKVGAYHFMTKESGKAQFQHFKKHLQGHEFELVPALDVETNGITQALVDDIGKRLERLIVNNPVQFGQKKPSFWDIFKSLIRGAGMPYPHPAIYTNLSLGNSIFKSTSMNRYPLWIATRNISTPTIPNIWKSTGHYIWQNAVTSGVPYGISGNVDHNYWGTFLPFPGDVPVPPPDPEEELKINYIKINGETYSGKLPKV